VLHPTGPELGEGLVDRRVEDTVVESLADRGEDRVVEDVLPQRQPIPADLVAATPMEGAAVGADEA
jgi:hypothetical protein